MTPTSARACPSSASSRESAGTASIGDRPGPYRIWLVLAAVMVAACGTTPPPPPSPAVTQRPPVIDRPTARGQVGMATYYANRFAGRKTASGERYNPGLLTAAHRTLPFGTVVRVTRIDRSGEPIAGPVTVKINDRGPYAAGRIIDLSMAAARRLDMLRAGVVRVRVEVLSGSSP